ncbi:aspartic peptidase domain-containing protein [Podospora australis]|uniref:Aspartic peptidase domain-containing protein n=1 Tax=Podospora australis TaxID=1536484 RepID=A0AAN7AGF6_9PEZI|nr:aspartic peptidase domain-containing protein [Podospora australis]
MAFHPNAHSLIRVLFLLLSATSVCAAEPKQASWSNKPHGADGPWNAVTVSIGGQSDIALFPGRMFHTFVTTSDYCALNASTPQCESGTYLKDKVFEGKTRGAQGIRFRLPGQEYTSGIRVRGADASMFLDTLDLGSSGGRVDNASIALIESQMLEYPSGSHYPIFTGCLSVGAPDPKQVFVGSADIPTVNASLLPWALAKDDAIPSSSFGLHYGSAVASSAKMFGSLLYGGYDKNRVVGNVLSIDGHLWKPVLLQDISIRVVKGSSPFVKSFPSSNKNNLLRAGNSSIPTQGLPVILDPCSPYLTLPKSTCDAIADNLPVKYNDSLGLYLWDTTDPRYIQITTSASVLSFTFMGSSNTQTLNISVPFGHLNLSLAPPFMSSENPVPYFPCFTGGIGAYVLGRAFFQDAFLGANWEQKKLFLAQAPGPNIPAAVEAANIESGDATIKAGRNNWESSWEGVWRALTLEEASGSGSAPPPPPSGGPSSPPIQTADDKKGSEGLAAGAKIGIGVSVALAVLAGIAVGVFIWRRKQKTYGIRLDEGRLKAFPESDESCDYS